MISWSTNLAYVIGLITTDGCLSKDGRHIDFTSKDIEQIYNFRKCLKIKNKITRKISSYNPSGVYFRIQFGNVKFYRFLLSIGLQPNKSKTIGTLKIPPKYFPDFLRGHLDGDGNISVVKHPESQYPQLRIRFHSASLVHLSWIKKCAKTYLKLKGGFIENSLSTTNVARLVFAKTDAVQLLSYLYYNGVEYYLKRKYNTISGFPRGEWRNW